jgi:hypothetical protein
LHSSAMSRAGLSISDAMCDAVQRRGSIAWAIRYRKGFGGTYEHLLVTRARGGYRARLKRIPMQCCSLEGLIDGHSGLEYSKITMLVLLCAWIRASRGSCQKAPTLQVFHETGSWAFRSAPLREFCASFVLALAMLPTHSLLRYTFSTNPEALLNRHTASR